MTTIVEDWDELKDRLGPDDSDNAEAIFDMADRMADAIETMALALRTADKVLESLGGRPGMKTVIGTALSSAGYEVTK